MPYRTPLARFFALWPAAFAVLVIAYAWAIQEPHLFDSLVADRVLWLASAALLLISWYQPTRAWRLAAMVSLQFVFIVRAFVLILVPSDLSASRITAGVVVWLMFFVLVLFLTLASEIIDAPSRFARSQ